MVKSLLPDNDLSLWKKITTDIKPMPSSHCVPNQVEKPKSGLKSEVINTIEAEHSKRKTQVNPQGLPLKAKPADLNAQRYGGIAYRQAKAVKSGKAGYTQSIDLHGCRLDEAYRKLQYFIKSMSKEGHRHVLIITGKGKNNEGILRNQLPQWLNQESLSPYIIAYSQAQPKDGGAGAWYVNLRQIK